MLYMCSCWVRVCPVDRTKDLRIDACDRFLLGFAFPPLWYYATVLYFGNHLKEPRERPGLAASAIAVRNYADFSLPFFGLLMFSADILFPLVPKTCTGAGFNLLSHRRGCSTRCFLLAVAAGVMSLQEKERISATNCWQILSFVTNCCNNLVTVFKSRSQVCFVWVFITSQDYAG